MVLKQEIEARQKRLEARMRQRAIGRELRRRYADATGEPMPEDMTELLKEIDTRKDER